MNTSFIVFTIYLVISQCYQFPETKSLQYYVPIVNIKTNYESIVFSKEKNTDNTLLNSIVLGLYSNQTVLLARGTTAFKNLKHSLCNRHPNIVILIESLKLHEIQSAPFNAMLSRSTWSPLFLILTNRKGNKTCENGTFNKAFLQNTQDYMNEIWHTYQIVTVIVSFPYTCPYHYIIYNGKKPSNKELYDRTIKTIIAKNEKELKTAILANSKLRQLTAGYPLRANIFYRFPTSITQCNNIDNYKKLNYNYTNGFCGLDALIMQDFIEHYQYNLTVPKDEMCDVYGFVEPDTQVVTGSLGCILREQMDISFNSRFMVQYTTKHYFYLNYIKVDSLAFVLKRTAEIPLWHYAFNQFDLKSGLILPTMILVLGVLTWASAWITRKITGKEPKNIHVFILNALTYTLFGFPISGRNEKFRILRGTSLICSVLLLALYQGNVNYQFTTRSRYKEIKTLDQLFHSRYVLYTSPSIQNLLKDSMNLHDSAQASFLHRTQTKDETLGIAYVLENENAGTLARGDDVLIEILLNYTDKAGSPLMYVVEQKLHVYYLSFIARSGFLFVEESLCFMMRMLEAGLPDKYYAWSRRSLKLEDTFPTTGSEPRPANKINLENLRVAFYALTIGCLLSSFSFFVELYRGKVSNKKYAVPHNSHPIVDSISRDLK